jgi:DNA-binding NarL/FixJ family response regulator
MPASLLLVEEHTEVRSALRDWLLTSFPPLKLSEARGMEEALQAVGQAGLDFALVNLELPGPTASRWRGRCAGSARLAASW